MLCASGTPKKFRRADAQLVSINGSSLCALGKATQETKSDVAPICTGTRRPRSYSQLRLESKARRPYTRSLSFVLLFHITNILLSERANLLLNGTANLTMARKSGVLKSLLTLLPFFVALPYVVMKMHYGKRLRTKGWPKMRD